MSGESDKPELVITNAERNINAVKSLLKLLPGGTGEAFIQLFSGPIEAAQGKRLADTVDEIKEMLRRRQPEEETYMSEEFASVLRESAGPISRATNEDKRRRFRDLLFHSMLTPPGDRGWEESMHCLELLNKIQPVGLYVIARIARADRDSKRLGVSRFNSSAERVPSMEWVFVPRSDLPTPSDHLKPKLDDVGEFEATAYDAVLVEAQIKSLLNDFNLIRVEEVTATRGSSATRMEFLELTQEGRLLVKWTVEDF